MKEDPILGTEKRWGGNNEKKRDWKEIRKKEIIMKDVRKLDLIKYINMLL